MSAAELRTEWLTDRGGLAHVLGCSAHHVHKLVAKGMPRAARGRYDVAECVQWYIARLESGGARDPDDIEEVVRERTRLYAAQARYRELETAHRERELVTLDEASTALQELAALFVMGLQAFPVRAAARLVSVTSEAEAIEVANRETHDTLEAIRAGLPALVERLSADRSTADATAETDGSGMG